jgi:peptidoglycan/LPS O-acetylase OafA/YrhL
MLSRYICFDRHSLNPVAVEPELGKHLPALDAIRGLAIIAVLIYRFGGGSPHPASVDGGTLPLLHLGMRGVDLFFVLSGFLITGILYDARGKEHFFSRFYWRRTVRIFPLYYAVLFLSLVVTPVFLGIQTWNQAAIERSPWLWCYGTNISQSATGEWSFGWFNHFWSLAVEEHFYLAWPAVIWCCSRRGAMTVCIFLGVGSLTARVLWLAMGGNTTAAEVFTLFRLDGLTAGAWLALAARDGQGLVRFAVPAKAICVATLVILLPISWFHLRLLSLPGTAWSVLFASLLLLVVTAPPGSWLGRAGECGVFQWFGKYSYGMYVFANLLIPLSASVVTAPGMARWMGSALLGQIVYLVTMTAITAGTAVASWFLFERHFLALKSLFETRNKMAAYRGREITARPVC